MPRDFSASCERRGVERALAGLVDHDLAGFGGEARHDGAARLARDQDAAHRAGIADALARRAALPLARRQVRQVRLVAFARVDDGQRLTRGNAARSAAAGRHDGARRDTSLPSDAPKPPGSRKSRCMSIMTSATDSRGKL